MTTFQSLPPTNSTARHRRSGALRATAIGLVLSLSGPVWADTPQPADAQLLADTLFRAGRQLMDQGDYTHACRKLEESYRLDAAAGTLLALATCHELEGRIATAWGEFNQALATARREGRADREGFAKEHVASLESALPRVVIDVPDLARTPGLTVTRNGTELTEASWGIPLPSDPGEIVVSASAPGHHPWSDTVKAEKGTTTHVTVPKLEDAPEEPIAPVAASPVVAPPSPIIGHASLPPVEHGHDYRTIAYVTAAVGVVGLGVGTYFGVHALSEQHTSNADCPTIGGAQSCSQVGVAASGSAVASAHWADATLGIGVVGLVTGTILYFVSHPDREPSPHVATAGWSNDALRFVPTVTPQGGGLAVSGAF